MHTFLFVYVMFAFSQNSRAMIYIEENSKMADVVFPTKPIVVSLKDYDDVSSADDRIINGYPVICVSVSKVAFEQFVLRVIFMLKGGAIKYYLVCIYVCPNPMLSDICTVLMTIKHRLS